MGWPWGSFSDSSAKVQDRLDPDSTLQDPSLAPDVIPAQAFTPAPPLSRDEAANAELRALIEAFESEDATRQRSSSSKLLSSPSCQTPSSSSSSSSTATFKSTFSLPEIPPPLTPINATLLYPTTMSCRAAFDAAFYCQSLGGQFNSIYRSGTLRSCSPLWSEFWFCMRTNRISLLGEEERKERVRGWYENREREKYGGGKVSSEDVWGKRDVTVAKAFEGDFEGVEGGVAMLRDRGGIDGLGEGG